MNEKKTKSNNELSRDSQILDVTAIVLANLCVSYIMTSQNEEAEELMRKIEKEEERVWVQFFFPVFCGSVHLYPPILLTLALIPVISI